MLHVARGALLRGPGLAGLTRHPVVPVTNSLASSTLFSPLVTGAKPCQPHSLGQARAYADQAAAAAPSPPIADTLAAAALATTTAAAASSSSASSRDGSVVSPTLPTTSAASLEDPKTGVVPSLRIFGYSVCPYSNKARAYLEYAKIPHSRVEVNPLTKKEMSFSKYRKTPFALIFDPSSGETVQVNGSDAIIDYVDQKILKHTPPSEEVAKWRAYVDDVVVHLLPPNIYRTPGEALQAFDYIALHSKFTAFERFCARYTGGLAMYFIAKRSLKKYNIVDPRKELVEATTKWAQEGLKGQRFHGGPVEPDLADLSFYGVIRSIEDNYATWEDLQRDGDPKFWVWYEDISKLVRTRRENSTIVSE